MGNKLDLGAAWNSAVALMSANKDVILVVAGVFFFLPNAIFTMVIPEVAEPSSSANPDDIEMVYAQAAEQLSAHFSSYWWTYLLLGVVQTIGVLGLLTLLTDRARPTVGEALQAGAAGLLPYFAAQIGVYGIFAAVFAIGFLISPAVGALLALPLLIAFLYVSIKVSLLTPVIAIERERNPLAAIKRSWQLTKGNSFRILAFFLLLMIVLIVITLIAGLLFSLFAALGDSVGGIVIALGNGLISMFTTTVSLTVLAAIYYQLSGDTGGAAEVFD